MGRFTKVRSCFGASVLLGNGIVDDECLDRGDVRRIKHIGKIANPGLAQGTVAHDRGKQLEHWRYMFSHQVDGTFVAKSEQIGEVHARIGLEPRWYIGGYAWVLEEMGGEILGKGALLGAGKSAGVIGTLIKLALLDMTVALSAYFKAEERKRQDVIDKLGTALSAVAAGNFTHALRCSSPSSPWPQPCTSGSDQRDGVVAALPDGITVCQVCGAANHERKGRQPWVLIR